MNFTRFPAGTTNIFPIANSKTGGQLLTEFNLRSRESVLTDENVEYMVGPSYTHSQNDFIVRSLEDEIGTVISSTAIEITTGRALVNGHYFESNANVIVDIAEANIELQQKGMTPLKGHLAVGLRAMYSTEQTISASMRTENNESIMEGIQIVILPIGKVEPGYFVLPSDSPDTDELVTAHLKLAEFYYVNGTVRSISQNTEKTLAIPAERIQGVDDLFSNNFISRKGLNPKKLYTFAGKSADPNSNKDTWCDSTDSLFIFQKASDLKETEEPQLDQADFLVGDKEVVQLVLPHKHIDGGMFNSSGKQVWYTPRIMNFPQANYSSNAPGTVTSDYTKSIKAIKESLYQFYKFTGGKQRGYIQEISSEKREELPTINQNNWNIGDYILVCIDNSVIAESSDLIQSPSTLYFVLPPKVTEVEYLELVKDSTIPESLTGSEIHREVLEYPGSSKDDSETVNLNLSYLTEEKEAYNETLGVTSSEYRGELTVDYITVVVTNVPEDGKLKTYYYYYKVTKNEGKKEYSEPVLLTGTIPLATEDTIGGFLNIPDTSLDNGYVIRDEDGHLKLLDYSLLRSGVLAYQLGVDYEFGSGLSIEEIQSELDEYVNNRVAFRSDTSELDARYSDMIKITLDLAEETVFGEINIENIDSRFGTGVWVTITGSGTPYTTVNIKNCEKVRLDIGTGNPIVNLYNSNLYYDADTIEYIQTCDRVHESDKLAPDFDQSYAGTIYDDNFNGISNLRLWYEKFNDDDPNFIVNDMTVTETDTPIIPEDIDFWSETVVNDNHYYFGLQSLTFSPTGNLVGCGLYMRNDMSANIDLEKTIAYAEFTLPNGNNLTYPKSALTKKLKVTGNFVTAYESAEPQGFITMTTNFTALSQYYTDYDPEMEEQPKGTISFLSDAMLIENYVGMELPGPIDGWESNSYHVFQGWTIG